MCGRPMRTCVSIYLTIKIQILLSCAHVQQDAMLCLQTVAMRDNGSLALINVYMALVRLMVDGELGENGNEKALDLCEKAHVVAVQVRSDHSVCLRSIPTVYNCTLPS